VTELTAARHRKVFDYGYAAERATVDAAQLTAEASVVVTDEIHEIPG
jgi:hypothetical protein